MLLGILLHAANPYRPGSTWLVVDHETSAVMDWVVDGVHLFRMPGFFVVAGFFAMHSLVRRSTTSFLRERMTRLLVPCLATLLFLNVPQTIYLAHRDQPTSDPATAVWHAWFDGRLIGHLWFLIDLALYLAVVGILAGWIRTRSQSFEHQERTAHSTIATMTALGVCWAVAIAVLDYFGPPWLHQQAGGIVNPVEWLEYAPYFVAGLVMFDRPRLLSAFASLRWFDVATMILAAAGTWYLRDTSGILAALGIATRTLLSWQVVRSCFALFRECASHPSLTFRYLSDSSYTVYLFHHVLVVLFAELLVPSQIPAIAKFLIVAVSASSVSVAIYHLLIRPSSLLTFLFNGRRPSLTTQT